MLVEKGDKLGSKRPTIMVGRRHLTEDLLVDVLLRLPVETLLRCKCVCKHWYALIKSPSFIEKHFHHKNNRARLLICNLTMSLDEGKSVDFSLLPDKIVPGVHPEQKILHQFGEATDFTSVAGPVDGLFLLEKAEFLAEDDSRLALWNPATREFWPLPPVSFELHPLEEHDYKFALGFDPSTRDYKVLWVRIFWGDWGMDVSPNCFISVYSLRNNSWKNLKSEFPYCCSLHEPIGSTYLNGVYYWLSGRLDNKSWRICSFDMGSEQFGEMQGPVIPNAQWGKLMLRGESLAIIVIDPGKPMACIYDVWVMKQEGSWTKVLTTVQPLLKVACWPRSLWEDDKMIFESFETSQLVLYDPTTRQVTDLGFQLELIAGRYWVFNYKESLVPIRRGNDNQGKDNAVEQIDHFFNSLQRTSRPVGCYL
ncbi:F-box protein CPR1-like isoform X2 [Lycium barbarum]|uniref:F-box protein CPR1-like isoform X2 n=1 Tax=Lycium barbarum TaxID=112863 RepID=UPI00293E8D93|nr:F-box protein CPR1-like isoform X2 [Lycium barbarum]